MKQVQEFRLELSHLEPDSVSVYSSNTSSSKISKAFTYVEDITPTILEYAGVQHPSSSYNGHEVHPIMGKSLKASSMEPLRGFMEKTIWWQTRCLTIALLHGQLEG